MFHFVEKNQKLVKSIMIIVAATFVFFGIGSYLGAGGDDGYVAKVGNKKIYNQEIEQAILNNPQFSDKNQALFTLINRQLLINNFESYHVVATKEDLQEAIANIPSFQDNGKFSLPKYQKFLKSGSINVNQFQDDIQNQILINDSIDLFKGSYFTSKEFNQKFANFLSRERSIETYVIKPQQFYASIKPTEKEINNYYQQNLSQYTQKEKVKVQYIQLSATSLAKNININQSILDKYITEHKSELENKQVKVAHILFKVPNDANASKKEQIRSNAFKILEQIKLKPYKFSEYARRYSQDSASAKNGGNLGFFGHGIMEKSFESAAFNLKPNQMSELVETKFGYHIIKLQSIQIQNSTQIKDHATEILQKQQVGSVLARQLEALNDTTYNKPNSLEPAVQKLNLALETESNWIEKTNLNNPLNRFNEANNTSSNSISATDFSNKKIQKAIFSEDVIKNHNNSEVVDLGNGNYAVYRVTEYAPAKVRPLNEVSNQIIQNLKSQQATLMVYQTGQDNITKLQQGKLKLDFKNAQDISLLGQTQDISPMATKQIFSTSLKNLPAYTGSIDQDGNFVIYKINKESINENLIEQNQQVLSQMGVNNAMLDLASYVSYLKSKYSVEYKIDRLKNASENNGSQ